MCGLITCTPPSLNGQLLSEMIFVIAVDKGEELISFGETRFEVVEVALTGLAGQEAEVAEMEDHAHVASNAVFDHAPSPRGVAVPVACDGDHRHVRRRAG